MPQTYELRCRFNHSTLKVCRDDADRGHDTYRLFVPKNGSDCCSVTFWSNDPIDGLRLEVDDFRSPSGFTITPDVFKLAYIGVRGRPVPDAMLPNEGGFSVSRDHSQMFVIRLITSSDTPAGMYESAYRVYKNGEVISSAKFSAQIWDFELPGVPSCGTLFGLKKSFIEEKHGVSGEDGVRLYRKYYDFLLQNKICAYALPYDILDTRADEYLNDERVTGFVVPFARDDDELLRSYYNKLSSNPVWFRKGVFYPIDEPASRESFDRYEQICKRLSRLYPGYKIITPLGESRIFDDGEDSVSLLAPYQTRWCPRSDMFDLNGSAGYMNIKSQKFGDNRGAILERHGNMLERIEKERAGGDEIWWYVCGFPYLMSYCDLNIDNSGAQHRVLFWQQFAFDVEGLLYWCANHWKGEGSPWKSPFNYDKIRYGDGSLLYDGSEVGIDGPVGSLRILQIRAGIEDFELLTLAEKHIPKERLDAIINPVINPSPDLNMALQGTPGPGICVFSDDDDTLYQARYRLGCALEAAARNK